MLYVLLTLSSLRFPESFSTRELFYSEMNATVGGFARVQPGMNPPWSFGARSFGKSLNGHDVRTLARTRNAVGPFALAK